MRWALLLLSVLTASAQLEMRQAPYAALLYKRGGDVFSTAGFWLDASQTNTIFQDSNFVTNSPLNGTAVGGWIDAGGNTNRVMSTGLQRPTFFTNWSGGKPAVFFDGGIDTGVDFMWTLTNTLGFTSSSTGWTMLVVGQWNASAFAFDVLMNFNVGTNSNVFLPIQRNNLASRWLFGSSIGLAVTNSADITNTQKFVVLGRYNSAGGALNIRFTGQSEATNSGAAGGIGNRGIFTLGGFRNFDFSQPIQSFLVGYIGEVAVWPYYLSDVDASAAFLSRSNKWAIP